MCARYTLTETAAELARHFWFQRQPELVRRYNIAPTQPVGVVVEDRDAGDGPQFRMMHWGLIPKWAKDPSVGNRMINARSETVTVKPAYRAAIKYRRCLIPADGYYEWKRVGQRKQPYRITLTNRSLFAMAGLWEHWQGQGGAEIESCTLLTTASHGVVAQIHHRMPVILSRDNYRQWMDAAETDPGQVLPYLGATPFDRLASFPVNTLVNNPRNDVPACIEPQPSEGEFFPAI